MEKRPLPLASPLARLKKPPTLSHLKHLTTRFGIVQHTREKHHDLRFGYSIDDAARGLIICVWYGKLFGAEAVRELAPIYFRFIQDAQLPTGRFHNFRDADGHWLDVDGGDDPLGRSLWALGTVLGAADDFGLKTKTQIIYDRARVWFDRPGELWTRALAFGLLGAQAAGDKLLVTTLTHELEKRFYAAARADWPWFEDTLRYANGIIPYALLISGEQSAETVALQSLKFLNQVSRVDGRPAPIGNRGWYSYGGQRAIYDQQCIEATDMILANGEAWNRTRQAAYRKEAEDWFKWFFGFNMANVTLVTEDGGCYDGIGQTDINPNQGAESTIAYLLAHLALCQLTIQN